jgi:hypothetical protein
MSEQRTTLERHRRALHRLVDAVGASPPDLQPHLDRLAAALVRERHAPLAAWLSRAAYPLTWEGIAMAADSLPAEGRAAAALEHVLHTALVVAVWICWD